MRYATYRFFQEFTCIDPSPSNKPRKNCSSASLCGQAGWGGGSSALRVGAERFPISAPLVERFKLFGLHCFHALLAGPLSCKTISIPALDKIIPVNPPIVNKKINPIAKSIGVLNWIRPPHMVAIHENILIPVGTAIIMVAAVKYIRVSTSRPTVYMWCSCSPRRLSYKGGASLDSIINSF